MISHKRDWIIIAPFGQLWKETPLVLWLLEKTESTRHVWCLKRARAGSWCGGMNSLSAVDCTSLGPVWRLGVGRLSLLAPCHPAGAGFSSACGSYVDFVRSVSLWIGCGMVQSQGLLWIIKKSFLFWLSSLRVWWVDFLFAFFCLFVLFVYFFYHWALQLLVYMRTVEFDAL